MSLPAAAICGFGIWFCLVAAPAMVSGEKRRAALEYRQAAECLRESPESAVYHGERKKGWRQTGRLGGRGADSRAWGYVDAGERVMVWVEDSGGAVYGAPAERGFADTLRLCLLWGAAAVVVLVVALTAFCIRFFVRFAAERDDFLAATAHDLTTPLVGMRYMIGRSDGEARILNERMIRLVDNIKEFLRRGGRRIRPGREEFVLRRAFDEAYSLFAGDFAEEPSGPVSVTGETDIKVVADETLVTQIFWNLLGNALKYAAPYGAVEVRFMRRGGAVRVEFADEGPGMTPRQMRRAFDFYYRAQTAMSSGKGGFGIGLCTARDFARSMGGSLSVAANSPRGCVFALELPAARHGPKGRMDKHAAG